MVTDNAGGKAHITELEKNKFDYLGNHIVSAGDATTGETAQVVTSTDRDTNLDGSSGLVTNAIAYGRVSDTIVKPARLDALTEASMIVDYGHHEIHEGSMYCLGVNSVAGNNGYIEILLTPPDLPGKEFHLVWEYVAATEGNFQMIEGVTGISGGTAATPVNHNRNSSNTSLSVTTLTGVPGGNITYSGGTVLSAEHFGSGKQSGGQISRGSEWILKAGVSTVFQLQSEAVGSELWMNLRWYEHTARN